MDAFDPEDDDLNTPAVGLHISRLDDIEPFNSELGELGGSAIPQSVVAAAGVGYGERKLFATLDGARFMGLPEILEASGLEHTCLFQGSAEEDLGDVAPWLVALEENSSFVRHLFTDGPAHWHGWGRGSGIFLSSSSNLSDLRRHLRRFTRIALTNGRWAYCRFADPRWVAEAARLLNQTYSANGQDHGLAFFGPPVDAILVQTGPTEMLRVSVSSEAMNEPLQPLSEDLLRLLNRRAAIERVVRGLAARDKIEATIITQDERRRPLIRAGEALFARGFTSRYHLAALLLWHVQLDADLLDEIDNILPNGTAIGEAEHNFMTLKRVLEDRHAIRLPTAYV